MSVSSIEVLNSGIPSFKPVYFNESIFSITRSYTFVFIEYTKSLTASSLYNSFIKSSYEYSVPLYVYTHPINHIPPL
jgi:hypothetical protein